ncbi:polymer-forming cytoskeletal protein [Patescibacteria group bacterium]|nr:polymer-forming cytoskeletal protein [Patescibacteria group bacterium]
MKNPIFKDEEKEFKKDDIETIIGPSVKVEGDFVANGDVVVEGIVSGNLKTEANLKIGPQAKIFANVRAGTAQISGEVQGNVKVSDRLELHSTARVFGDIKTKILVVAEGASIDGKCHCGSERKSKLDKLEPEKPEKKEKALPILSPTKKTNK